MPSQNDPIVHDVFVIGGGVNGCGIARDAAGRGLSVVLAEMNDLASATSSASTKLFHGGLRYLEHFEFRLVRKALSERETLLKMMPHISQPMRFILPIDPEMRFPSDTPASRLLRMAMPWLRGRRPVWLIRAGLFLYDHLGGREILPGTGKLDLRNDEAGRPLKPGFSLAYEYSDCCVDDSRLVVLNARDAFDRGAQILTRTRVVSAQREDGLWRISLSDVKSGKTYEKTAKVLINATGPYVDDVLKDALKTKSDVGIRLVRGSHIVVKKLFDHERSYFFQGKDGRIVFAIPFEQGFTMIGTTDEDHPDARTTAVCSQAEADYLRHFVSVYFDKKIRDQDIVWRFSGVRPLFDDGSASASATTRDYVLKLDVQAGAPLLNIYGGKITTYRTLAENALDQVSSYLPEMAALWTDRTPLPGGAFHVSEKDELAARLASRYRFLDAFTVQRLVRTYGTDAFELLGDASKPEDLGLHFGAGLSQREVSWLVQKEFAQTVEDVIWRRTKLGLRMGTDEVSKLHTWMAQN